MAASNKSLDMGESLKDSTEMIEYLVGQVANPANRSEFRELLGRLESDTITEELPDESRHDSLEQLADAVSISSTLEPTDNRNTVRREWKVVDELVYNSITIAIQRRMDNFADEHLKWTVITSPTVNDRITIHLAMGIGANLVAGIRFVDLTPVSADQKRLAVECLHEEAHCQVSSTTITLSAPDEHYAIKEDDPKLLEWLLAPVQGGSSSQHTTYGTEGMNLLHLAAQGNSSSVVKWLSEKLTYDRWLELSLQKDINGNSPIHIAIIAKGSAVLHQLLKPLSKEDLEALLHIPIENSTCQTALQLVNDDRQYKDLKGLIEYHRQLREEDQLMEYFDEFEFGLFSYELKSTREKIVHRRIEDRSPEDPATKRNINMDAAICLMQGNTTKAEALIDTAMKIVPEDINTWCNRGKYLLMLEDGHLNNELAMEAAFKMLELLTDQSLDNRLRAKIDYAYFIAEANRGDEDRRHSKVIFDECLAAVGQCTNSELMRAHCCHLFIKTLVRILKSRSRNVAKSEAVDDLHKAFDLLAELATLNHSPQYNCDMWVWLAEVQFLRVPGASTNIDAELEEFTQRTGLDATKPFDCLEKASKIVTNNESKVNRKARVNIARNCLKLAYSTNNMVRRSWLLKRAVTDSQSWIDANYWTYECANTAAESLWQLWNLEMYNQHTDLVKETSVYISGGRTMLTHDHFGVSFCTREFYHPFLRGHPITQNHLPRAKEHLARLMDEDDGWACCGAKYARIKYLLGDPHEEIEAAFKNTLERCDPGVDKSKALQYYGFYLGIMGKWIEAKIYLCQAIDEGGSFVPHLAHKGRKLLRQGLPFFPARR